MPSWSPDLVSLLLQSNGSKIKIHAYMGNYKTVHVKNGRCFISRDTILKCKPAQFQFHHFTDSHWKCGRRQASNQHLRWTITTEFAWKFDLQKYMNVVYGRKWSGSYMLNSAQYIWVSDNKIQNFMHLNLLVLDIVATEEGNLRNLKNNMQQTIDQLLSWKHFESVAVAASYIIFSWIDQN